MPTLNPYNLHSAIDNPTPREVELLAVVEALTISLAEASAYVAHLGGASEAVEKYMNDCHNEHYLNQHDIILFDVWKIVEPPNNCPVS